MWVNIDSGNGLLPDRSYPDTKVHGDIMGPTWVLSAPGGPHIGPMNLAIRVAITWAGVDLKGTSVLYHSLRATSKEVLVKLVRNVCSEITLLRLLLYISGVYESIHKIRLKTRTLCITHGVTDKTIQANSLLMVFLWLYVRFATSRYNDTTPGLVT